jgi:ABC-type amino acid transport substrate-binding protein
MRLLSMIAALTGAVLMIAPCRAQTPEGADALPQRELVLGTKEAPPFSMKAPDGGWHGLSIDLWRHVADDMHLHYRFVEEPDVQTLLDGITTGKFDAAVAAVRGLWISRSPSTPPDWASWFRPAERRTGNPLSTH